MAMARILSVANQKGGVGKTTTAVNLSAALAELDQRVLLIDLDPQGNGSSGLGYPKDDVEFGIYDALLGLEDMKTVLLPTRSDRLFLAPATRDLVGVDIELAVQPRRERKLAEALAPVLDDFDYVIMDCPPSLGLLTLNALAASDGVLIPLQAQYYAMEGLGDLLRTLAVCRESLNPRLVREGIVLTMADKRTNLAAEVEKQAREVFGEEVFRTVVPMNVRLAEAPSHGRTVLEYDPFCSGSTAYRMLAAELLGRNCSISRRVAS
jgi:chromosome partitioning protein